MLVQRFWHLCFVGSDAIYLVFFSHRSFPPRRLYYRKKCIPSVPTIQETTEIIRVASPCCRGDRLSLSNVHTHTRPNITDPTRTQTRRSLTPNGKIMVCGMGSSAGGGAKRKGRPARPAQDSKKQHNLEQQTIS